MTSWLLLKRVVLSQSPPVLKTMWFIAAVLPRPCEPSPVVNAPGRLRLRGALRHHRLPALGQDYRRSGGICQLEALPVHAANVDARRNGRMTVDGLRNEFEERGITKVKLVGFDIDGVGRGKYISLDKFFSVAESGFG